MALEFERHGTISSSSRSEFTLHESLVTGFTQPSSMFGPLYPGTPQGVVVWACGDCLTHATLGLHGDFAMSLNVLQVTSRAVVLSRMGIALGDQHDR